jgi:hypothetical protein
MIGGAIGTRADCFGDIHNWLVALQVDQENPVTVPFVEGPIIDTHHTWYRMVGEMGLSHTTQQRLRTDRHPRLTRQPGTGLTAKGKPNEPQGIIKTKGTPAHASYSKARLFFVESMMSLAPSTLVVKVSRTDWAAVSPTSSAPSRAPITACLVVPATSPPTFLVVSIVASTTWRAA